MAKATLKEFLHDRTLLAIKISSASLSGLFRKSFTVPLNTSALVHHADGRIEHLRSGREITGAFDLVLAKEGDIQARYTLKDLRTKDGFAVSAACTIALALPTEKEDLFRDFCRTLYRFPGAYGVNDLKGHIAPELKRALGDYIAARPASELHRRNHSEDVGAALRPVLERHLFDAGVRYHRLVEVSVTSGAWAKRAASEARRAEARLQSAAVMDRKEERLRRLASILKDQDVQGLLTKVPDERLKGLLYAKLMEDDHLQITAEELVSKAEDCGEEVVQVIYKAMENLLSTGASVSPDEIENVTAGRVFAAAGSRVLEIDPAGKESPVVHAFPESLRSIRCVDTPRGRFLLGGTKRGVAVLRLDGKEEVLRFPLPDADKIRGGVNSIALSGDHLFATHSEFGLARWRADSPDEPAELLFPEITNPHGTTRGVQLEHDRLLFTAGHHVYRVNAGAEDLPVKYVSSIESPVTCVAAAARTIFAGTENGSILCWKLDAPDQPVVLVRRRDAIVNLRLARICAIPHLIYSTRDLSIRARVIGQNLETAYETGGPRVGVIDAASDVICASASDGRRVLLWKATVPSRPSREIDVHRQTDRPVLDLWMQKVRSRSA